MFYRNYSYKSPQAVALRGIYFGELQPNSQNEFRKNSLRQKCPYSELFWSALSGIRTEYGEIQILRISLYSVQMRENADENNSEYGHFLRSDCYKNLLLQKKFPWR